MNAIAVIGDRSVVDAALSYAGGADSTLWVLGHDRSSDVRIRPLDKLIEPVIGSYFLRETIMRIEYAARFHKARAAGAYGPFAPDDVGAASDVTMRRCLAECMAIVEMLDRANAVAPIELVVAPDDREPSTGAAFAWAAARAIPSLAVGDGSALAGRLPAADAFATFGARGRAAYAAAGAADARLTVAAHPKAGLLAGLAPRRTAYRQKVHERYGWTADDCIIVFEPRAAAPELARSAAAPDEASIDEMFRALIAVRRTFATARLAVLPRAAGDKALAMCQRVAAGLGLTNGDYLVIVSEEQTWLSIADVVVSTESPRSMEAALLGIPAINVWQPETWYAGPAFAAEDGIIDVLPEALAPTLTTLAGNRAIGGQIGERSRARAGAFGLRPPLPTELAGSHAIAADIARLRRPQPPAKVAAEKLDIIIYAPSYLPWSAGIRALYRFCHYINLLGEEASIYPVQQLHPTWRTPGRTKNMSDKTIVVYPEVLSKALPTQRNVRWVLNNPGVLGGPTHYDDDEMVFYYSQEFRAGAQAATSETLGDERELYFATIEPDLFYLDRSSPRLYDCVYVGKAEESFARNQKPELRDAFVITRGALPWPGSREETAALLRGCRRLYSYDGVSAILAEALICGVEVKCVREDGSIEDIDADTSPYIKRAVVDYRAQYYDMTQTERFLRLVRERWT